MSTTTVTADTAEPTRQDVRGIPLDHEPGGRVRDPFIGACPDWCDGRHSGLEQHDDRWHYGEEVDIALELEVADYDEVTRTHHLATIRTYLRQHYRETQERVYLARGEGTGVELTLAEALLLRDRLSDLLEAAGYEV